MHLSQPGPPHLFRWDPRAAYNEEKREYLIVWDNGYPQDFHDIYARRLSASGELKNAFMVAGGIGGDGKVRRNPALGNNAADGEYLVVYMLDHVGSGYQYEIWAAS